MRNLAVALLLVSSVSPSLSESSEGEGATRIPPFSSPLARLSLSAYGSDTQGDATPQEEDTASDVQARIVGGNQASAGEYPFYVQGDGCGGSLIWKDIVLTAGHCKGYWDTAWVGAYKYQSTSYGAEKISTVREVRHSDFSSKTYDWDFMIVQLSKSSSKETIRMNTDSTNPSGSETLRVIGMGVTNENSYKDPDFLREVSVANVPASTCADKYDGEFFDTSTMMCAASPGKDSCFGDSGGPIFDGNGVQVGVVSWGIGCARSKYPGVYSRVSKGHSWIKQQVCKYSKGPPSSCGRRRRLLHRTERSLRGVATPTTPSVSVNATTAAASATCSDSDETFELFDRPDVEHDCSWLRDNRFSEGDDLCDFLHVAFRCPSTCEDCSVLSD